ncbi:MAG: stage III sporulation protein AE [Clostridia bacterium]|nr:stage III sporulation protein AE [Clostridia bacterium]
MKWKLLLLLITVILVNSCGIAYADTIDELTDTVDQMLEGLDFSDIDSVAGDFIDSVYDKIQQIINGQFDSAESFWNIFWELLGSSLSNVSAAVVSVGIIMIILGLVKNTSDGLIGESTQTVISFVGVCLIVSSIVSLLADVYASVFSLMDKLASLSQASFPIMLTLLVSNGGNAVSTVCQPSMVIFSSFVIELVKNVILPFSVSSMIFVAVSSISRNIRLNKTASTIQSISTWLLGIVFMFFSAFTTVQGIGASTIDSVSFRAAKFAAKNYVPILGGYLAEGFDMVVASTTLVKNSFGIVCVLAIFLMIINPLSTILATNLSVQILTSVCEPIVDEKYITMLSKLSKCLSFLGVLVIAVAFMFCILLFICISCCNMV